MSTPDSVTLRIAFAMGTSPEKWFRRFSQRIPARIARLAPEAFDDPMEALESGAADMAIVRLPSTGAVQADQPGQPGQPGAARPDAALPDSLHRIRLYDEAWGVAFEKEHVFSLSESIALPLLGDETILLTSTDPAQLRQMLPVAATGAGVVVGPRTILKTLSKKAISSSNLVDVDSQEQAEGVAPMSKTSIWLVWPKASDDEIRQEFVGIVQGRREGSTRAQLGRAAAESEPKRLSAREKTLAKQARRAGKGGNNGNGGAVGKRKSGGRGKRRR
nr:LysR family transcriptional regulator [Corynebacterium lactis]